MSLTHSPGYHHADRWTGVAASTAEYLEDYPNRISQIRFPAGALRAAEQFFDGVKYGLVQNRKECNHQTTHLEIHSPMYGICCFSIALNVFKKTRPRLLKDYSENELKKFEEKVINPYIEELRKIQQRERITRKQGLELFNFFEELMKQGVRLMNRKTDLEQRFGSDE